MRTRLLVVALILLLSLGLVTVALAAASSAQPASEIRADSAHPLASDPASFQTKAPDSARFFSPNSPNAELRLEVNYAHDWVYAYTTPNTPITITIAGKASLHGQTNENGQLYSWQSPWNPQQPDILPGDSIIVDTSTDQAEVDPVGTIQGAIDVDAETIAGTIQAPFGAELLTVRCEIWEENGPEPVEVTGVSAAGGTYNCAFSGKWDIQGGQNVAVIYQEPDGDDVINVLQSPWMIVNYAYDGVGGVYPAGHTFWITVTNGTGSQKATAQIQTIPNGQWGQEGFQTSGENWSPGQPDIVTGDWVYYHSDDGYTHSIQVGAISGAVDSDSDSVEGNVQAGWFSQPLNVECHPWGAGGPAPVKHSTAGPNGTPVYFCQWDPVSEWDIQPGQNVAVMYLEPDADRVINVVQQPDYRLRLRANYGHDWIEGNYEAGHTIWITATRSDGVSVKATASGQTGAIPWWGGGTGFSTDYNLAWDSGQKPDLAAGDWIFGRVDNGQTASLHLGQITGQVDPAGDSITGEVHASWYTQTLDIECLPWGAQGSVPAKNSTAGPGGSPPYHCQWDPDLEWDILAGQDVGVAYFTPDGQWVANALRSAAPHLWIQTWADGNPGEGGNFAINVQYQNDGDAPAEGTTITGNLLGGVTYLSDTSGLIHTGNGTSGDPLVWQVGDLANSQSNQYFQIFVAVTGMAPELITSSVQIETSTTYSQGDDWSKHSQWSGQIQTSDTRVNIGGGAWTGDPVPGQDFVYNLNVCNNGSTASTELTLTDTLPLSTTLVDWWPQNPGWVKVASASHLLVVSRPAIPGWWCGEVYARVNLDINALPGMPLTNTASIEASNDLTEQDNQTTFRHSVGEPRWNLALDKGWLRGSLTPGSDLYYELSYHNQGNLPVPDVRITSTLPAGATFAGSWIDDESGRHPFDPDSVIQGEQVVWDLGQVENGFGGRFTIQLHVDEDASPGMQFNHQVAIRALPVEESFEDNTIAWLESLNPSGANLRVDLQNYDWWGDNKLSYEVQVTNLGTQRLESFWITASYPVSTTFNGDWKVDHGGWYTLTVDGAHHQLIFWGEQLDPGSTAGLEFRVDLPDNLIGQKGLEFTARVEAPIPGDIDPSDNEDEVTAFTGSDLYVEKSLLSGQARPGEELIYSLKFGNAQSGSAWWWGLDGTAGLTETLPGQVEFISAELHYCGGTIWCPLVPVSAEGNTLSWQLWPIGTGQHNEIRLKVKVDTDVTGLEDLLNRVEIASDQPENDVEANRANNSASLVLPVALPYFQVSKTFASSQIAGMPVTYTLTTANMGNSPGTQIKLWDPLPGGVTYAGGGSLQTGRVSWTFPSLAPGASAAAGFTGVLQCTAGAVITNQSYQVGASDQGITSAYGAPVSFTIQAPTIEASAEASSATVQPGQAVSFTAAATTNGTPLTYIWKIGDTVIGSAAEISHIFSEPGQSTVVLTVTDGCGYTDSYSIQVEVMKRAIFLPIMVN